MTRRTATARRQRGAALLAIVLITVLALLGYMLGLWQDDHREQVRRQASSAQLAAARDALVGYALREWCLAPTGGQTPWDRMPCPTTASDGTASHAPPACDHGSEQTGRWPWGSLGTGALRDASGSCLWYRLKPSQPSPGASDVVAELRAPGPTLPGQNRSGQDVAGCFTGPNAAAFIDDGNDEVLELRFAALQAAMTTCPP